MSLSVITVTHRSGRTIRAYIDTFLASGSGSTDVPVEFIFVENSGDTAIGQHVHRLEQAGFPVKLIYTENHGFGAGCNAGAALASHNILLFVNPDVEFSTSIDKVANVGSGWGTVTQLSGTGGRQSFDLLPEFKSVLGDLLGRYRNITPPPAGLVHKLVPVGSFFCVARPLFMRAIGFDERIFLYHEESELARRLHKLSGPPIYVEEVVVRHSAFGSQVSSRSTLCHEMDGLFSYAAITGLKRVLWLRAAVLIFSAPFKSSARLRLVLFFRRLLAGSRQGMRSA